MTDARLRTPLCGTLGIALPIVQAPVGSATTAALVAAVSGAGALGTLALSWRSDDEIRRALAEVRARTTAPFAVNLVLAMPWRERLAVCLEEGVRIVSLSWGDASDAVGLVHDAGGIALVTVADARQAEAAAAAGADVLVAQGWEAGGHVLGEVATMSLVPAVVDVAGGTPVVAAGGIADGRGLAAVLALGADGAMVGTRFLAAVEADVHPAYRDALLAAAAADTVHTGLFDGGWPDAPHRVLRNSTLEAWERAGRPSRGARPGEGDELGRSGDGRPICRYDDAVTAATTGEIEALSLYAGQAVGGTTDVRPAAEIVRAVADGAVRTIRSLAGALVDGG